MIDIAYYTVTITNNFSGSSPADGFVDYKNSQEFAVFDPTANTLTNIPSTLDSGTAKARGYYRYKAILATCGFSVNILDTCDLVDTGATADAAPKVVGITLAYDKPSYLSTEDELNVGAVLYGADCIKRWVARALAATYTTSDIVYDPTVASTNSYVVRGPVQTDITVGSLGTIKTIEPSITVTLTGGDATRIKNAINNTVSY